MRKEIIIQKGEVMKGNVKETKTVRDALGIVSNFFNEKLDFKVVFIDTREEMNKVYSEMFKTPQKTEDWVVGGYFGGDSIYIFSEEVYEKISCHKKETFFPTLVHEMVHLFSNKLLKFHLPMWIDEGLAYVVANQDIGNLGIKQNLLKAYSEEDWINLNPYLTAGKFTRFLIDKYGKEKLFLLLGELDFYEKEHSFNKKFFNVFGKTFKELFDEWQP